MMPRPDEGRLSRVIDPKVGISNIPVILLTSLSDVKGSGVRLGGRGERLYIEARDAEIRELILKSFIMATISKSVRGVMDPAGDLV